jgi:adenylate cyclase
MFATGLASVASMLWLVIYWSLGPQFSSTLPFAFQILLATNLAVYIKWGNFDFFRLSQLALFLFFPFVVQWSIGNFITASGITIWGLLAPVGAILFFGVREAFGWFIAYLFLLAMSGFFDYHLASMEMQTKQQIPIKTAVVFFALNFAAVSTIVFLLLRFATIEKQKAQDAADRGPPLLQIEQERSERLLLNILPGSVAERLKNSNQTIADGFADVTVMFADIVNFTQVAEGMAPTQVFAMLNRIFSVLRRTGRKLRPGEDQDHRRRLHGGGRPQRGQTDYSDAIADMALAMRELLRAISRSTPRTLKCASASAPGRWWPAWSARRNSSTTCGATR